MQNLKQLLTLQKNRELEDKRRKLEAKALEMAIKQAKEHEVKRKGIARRGILTAARKIKEFNRTQAEMIKKADARKAQIKHAVEQSKYEYDQPENVIKRASLEFNTAIIENMKAKLADMDKKIGALRTTIGRDKFMFILALDSNKPLSAKKYKSYNDKIAMLNSLIEKRNILNEKIEKYEPIKLPRPPGGPAQFTYLRTTNITSAIKRTLVEHSYVIVADESGRITNEDFFYDDVEKAINMVEDGQNKATSTYVILRSKDYKFCSSRKFSEHTTAEEIFTFMMSMENYWGEKTDDQIPIDRFIGYILSIQKIAPKTGAGKREAVIDDPKQCRSIVTINNTDNMCCARAMACHLFKNHKNYAYIIKGRNLQKELAEEILKNSGLPTDKEIDIMELKNIEDAFKCQICVIKHDPKRVIECVKDLNNVVMYKGEYISDERQFWLLFTETANGGHFDAIKSIKGYFACDYYCANCLTTYMKKGSHKCFNPNKVVQDKSTTTKTTQSYGGRFIERVIKKGSNEEIQTIMNSKLQQGNKDSRIAAMQEKRTIFFDFETQAVEKMTKNGDEIDGKRHVVNLAVARTSWEDKNHIFWNINEFCEWIMNTENCGATCIAHNGRGYDFRFVLTHLASNGMLPDSIIRQNGGISYLHYKKNDIRFVDSLSFFLTGLSKLPAIFGFEKEVKKGHFPHCFNTPTNFCMMKDRTVNYIGPLPAKSMYGISEMSTKALKEFNEWHDSMPIDYIFNFRREFLNYCIDDVKVLQKACTKFREMMKEISDIDPFRYITLSSLCMAIFKSDHMEKDSIAQEINIKPISKKCNEWLCYIEQKLGYALQREFPIIYNKTAEKVPYWLHVDQKVRHDNRNVFYVDGFDDKTNTVYEFYGDYYHGNVDVYGDKMKQKYSLTQARQKFLESKYKVITIWENDFDKNIRNATLTEECEKTMINPRDSMFGGRCEHFVPYYKCQGKEKIYVADVVSLYPTVNAIDEYPRGRGTRITNVKPEDFDNYFGIVKCKVRCPQNGLNIPILPQKRDGKLMFDLVSDEKTEYKIGTWTTPELKLSLTKGYTIVEIYSLIHFENKTKGIFKKYVETFSKIKQECSARKRLDTETDEQYMEYKKTFKQSCDNEFKTIGLNVELDINMIEANTGKRQIAKICLNSLWGRMGMKPERKMYKYCKNYQEVMTIYNDQMNTNIEFTKITEDNVYVTFSQNKDLLDFPESTNYTVAAYTTGNARIRLYSMMDKLHPSQLLYCDTDSVFFVYDPDNKTHIFPTKDDNNEYCRVGKTLGNWEIEVNNGIEWVCLGSKNYRLITEGGKVKIANKGVKNTADNEDKLNFGALKNLVMQEKDNNHIMKDSPMFGLMFDTTKIECVPVMAFRNIQDQIFTKTEVKALQLTSTKRNYDYSTMTSSPWTVIDYQ